MRKLIVLFMLIAVTAIAQPLDEEPEPSWDNSLYGYEAQVAFGSKTNLVWESVSVVSTQILPAEYEMPDHFYGIVVVGSNRRTYWTGETPNSTPENPEFIKIGVHMPSMAHWWGFYRTRFRPFPLSDPIAGEGWSETSRWTAIIDLSAMPGIGAFVAEIGD